MNTTFGMIEDAVKIVSKDKVLVDSLRDWWHHAGQYSSSLARLQFEDWLNRMLDEVSACIGDNVTAERMAKAIRINAMGDAIAVVETKKAIDEGWTAASNGYVEDNEITGEVWFKGTDADKVYNKAKKVAEVFEKVGYYTDILIDEEDAREVTVVAVKDFIAE